MTTKQQSLLSTYLSLADTHPEYSEASLRAMVAKIHEVNIGELRFLDTATAQVK